MQKTEQKFLEIGTLRCGHSLFKTAAGSWVRAVSGVSIPRCGDPGPVGWRSEVSEL